ncbi:MAG: SlyX family protein [Treponema sp.]|nr:SlyX family protein [Treponema sp.]
MNKETDDRFTALETKVAYLEDFINQLQTVTVGQSRDLEILRKENKLLSDKLTDVMESLEDIPNRKPPHY